MEIEEKKFAEAVLRRLCQGAQINGIYFTGLLQVLFTENVATNSLHGKQPYLTLLSAWTVFDSRPSTWPAFEKDLPELSIEEEFKTLCQLRGEVVVDIFLGDEHPHLIVQLKGGRFLFVNGHNDTYESWHLGLSFDDPGKNWLVVACPGGGISVWAPEPLT